MLLLNSSRFGGGGGGFPELMPDPGFDTATAANTSGATWQTTPEVSVTGSALVVNTSANFRQIENAVNGGRAQITPLTNYNFKLVVATVPTAGRIRIFVDEYTVDFNTGGGTITRQTLWDTNADGTLAVGTISKDWTSIAGSLSASIVIEATISPVSFTASSCSLKAR